MKRAKITIYHQDSSEEVLYSKAYDPSKCEYGDWISTIGLHVNLTDGAEICIQPTLYRKIKREYIDV